MSKDRLRKELLQKRLGASKSFIKEASAAICRQFKKKFGQYNVYLLYWPIKSEVDTSMLTQTLFNEGKSVYLPCVRGENIIFKGFNGLSDLCAGSFGVCESTGKVLDEHADVVIIPAVAYDINCNRLGYGKGFYDRFLPSVKNALKVGFAFDFQVVTDVYAERFDQPVDFIITEKRIFERLHRNDTE